MTLITGVAYADQFVLMSGDMLELHSKYNVTADGYADKEGTIFATNGTRDKVRQISDYVLMSTCGVADVCDIIEERLRERLREGGDLEAASKALASIIAELRTEADDESIDEDLRFSFRSLFTVKPPFTAIYLSGFYSDGETGLVSYECGENSVVEEDRNPKSAEYFNGFADGIGTRYLEYPFDLGGAPLTLDNFSQQIVQIHTYISAANPQLVSSEYELYLMFKEPDSVPEVIRWTLDAAIYHDRISGVDTSAFVSPMNAYVSSQVSE